MNAPAAPQKLLQASRPVAMDSLEAEWQRIAVALGGSART